MKIVRLENRQIPEKFRTLITQLTGRPIHAFLWIIWINWSCGLALWLYLIGLRFRSPFVEFIIILSVAGGAFFFLDMVSALTRRSGRRWLFSVLEDHQNKVTINSNRLLFRLAPVLTFLAVLFFWYTQ